MHSIPYIRSVVRSTPLNKVKSGIESSFIRIDETWGIKYVRAGGKTHRNQCYNMQKRAAKFGAAPNVGDKITLKINRRKYYGYMTECITETILDRFSRNAMGNISMYNPSAIDGYDELMAVLEYDVKITTSDMHYNNLGWMPDGRLVAIDFGEENYIKGVA